jgi:integrase
MKRAMFFDYTAHSAATRQENEARWRTYRAAARRAGQDPVRPDLSWLIEFLTMIIAKRSLKLARRFANSIRIFLISHDAPVLLDEPAIQAILVATDNRRGGTNGKSQAMFRRAQYFSDAAYDYRTSAQYLYHVEAWTCYAQSNGWDGLRAQPEQIAAHIDQLGSSKAYSTCVNRRSAISHYLRQNSVPDVSHSPPVNTTLEGIKRQKPRVRTAPLPWSSIRQMLMLLADRGCDLRDKAMLQLLLLGPWSAARILLLDCDDVQIVDDGVVVWDRFGDRATFIGTVEGDSALNVRASIAALQTSVGSGLLFQRWSRQGWTGFDLSVMSVSRSMERVAKLAGAPSSGVVRAVKATFQNWASLEHSPTVIAHHLQLTSSRRLALRALDESSRAGLLFLQGKHKRGYRGGALLHG